MKEKKPKILELPAAVTPEDIKKFKEETEELKKWEENDSAVYQKKPEENKTEIPAQQTKTESSKPKKKYLLQAFGAAAFFAAGTIAGIGIKNYENELQQYGHNTLTRITNAAYAIAGKTPKSEPQETQKRGLTEQLEYLETALSKDEFASFQKDLEILLEKYSRINENTIKYEGGN